MFANLTQFFGTDGGPAHYVMGQGKVTRATLPLPRRVITDTMLSLLDRNAWEVNGEEDQASAAPAPVIEYCKASERITSSYMGPSSG